MCCREDWLPEKNALIMNTATNYLSKPNIMAIKQSFNNNYDELELSETLWLLDSSTKNGLKKRRFNTSSLDRIKKNVGVDMWKNKSLIEPKLGRKRENYQKRSKTLSFSATRRKVSASKNKELLLKDATVLEPIHQVSFLNTEEKEPPIQENWLCSEPNNNFIQRIDDSPRILLKRSRLVDLKKSSCKFVFKLCQFCKYDLLSDIKIILLIM